MLEAGEGVAVTISMHQMSQVNGPDPILGCSGADPGAIDFARASALGQDASESRTPECGDVTVFLLMSQKRRGSWRGEEQIQSGSRISVTKMVSK